ncbi:MAG: DUF2085 domain-containing protein [Anaerolineae bacterium]
MTEEAVFEEASGARVFRVGLSARLSKHWLLLVNLVAGFFAGLPWAAPALMAGGYPHLGRLIYTAYSIFCHQLPQRSYFLFGEKISYSMPEIVAVVHSDEFAALRAFLGTPEMGYKVALAHRTLAIYTGIAVGGLLFALLHRWMRPFPLQWYLLFLAPIALDGLTHMLTDMLPAITWRESNEWLRVLIGEWIHLPSGFYIGTGVGSLNWLLRTLTGSLLGLGTVWLVHPYLDEALRMNGADD